MKMAKKILSTVLAGAMLMGSALITQAASDENLFAEGFESTTAATGGTVDTTTFRNGNASYCIVTEEGKDAELIIPMADMAESIVGKHIVVEAWYHIEGELAGYKETEVEGEEEGTTTVVTGEQVTMAYHKNSKTVESFKGAVGTVYAMENALYPNTDTTGWHRIRIAGIPKDEGADADYTDNKLVIQLLGAADNVKLYVDDVRIFVTDNLVDLVTKGNSDFDTFDTSGINGWAPWDTTGDKTGTYRGTVEYDTTYATSGEYGIKLTRDGVAGGFGIQTDMRISDLDVNAGALIATSVDNLAVFGAQTGDPSKKENFQYTLVQAYHLSLTALKPYAVETSKTNYSLSTVPESNNAKLAVGRGNDGKAQSTSYVYLDSVVMQVVDGGVVGLKENFGTAAQGLGNAYEKCTAVKTLSHGDVVYPYAVLAEACTTPITILVARYKNVGNNTMLDDVSVQCFEDGYPANAFDTKNTNATKTTAITVPTEGAYTYKVMAWSGNSMLPIEHTAVYEVK